MFATTTGFCEPRLDPESIYALLYRECQRLFPDELFADLSPMSGVTARTRQQSARIVHDEAIAGRLDPEAAAAVIEAAGVQRPRTAQRPD